MIFGRQRTSSKSQSETPSRDDLETELRGMLRPRIGITGSYTRGNYGDELYVRVLEHWFGGWADLTLLTGLSRPSYFEDLRRSQVDAVDAVVLAGGDLLCPYRPRIDPDFVNPLYLRRPVYVAGIGVERNRPDINDDVVRRWKQFLTHPSVRSISTRDPGSAEWITDHIQPLEDINSHPDLVCALPLPPTTRPKGAPILGLVTRHIKDAKEYALMAEVARRLQAKGWRVRHIIGGVGAHGLKDLDNAAGLEVEGKEIVHSEDLDEISVAIGECSLLLSMKLHTTLVGTMYGVPTICTNPVVKARAFMASIGRAELAVSPSDERLLSLVEEGVPEVPMLAVDKLRSEAVTKLRSLSEQIWAEYRGRSAVRQHLLPEALAWSEDRRR